MTYEKGQNVFENIPNHGTVIAIATEEELKEFEPINIRYQTLSAASTVFSRAEAFEIIKNRKKWWENIYLNYDIPAAWIVALDEITGAIYIDNK